jgi:hypothetical protein
VFLGLRDDKDPRDCLLDEKLRTENRQELTTDH